MVQLKKMGVQLLCGMYGLALWFFQHAILTRNALKKIIKEYNEIFKDNGLQDWLLKEELLNKVCITAIFRAMKIK